MNLTEEVKRYMDDGGIWGFELIHAMRQGCRVRSHFQITNNNNKVGRCDTRLYFFPSRSLINRRNNLSQEDVVQATKPVLKPAYAVLMIATCLMCYCVLLAERQGNTRHDVTAERSKRARVCPPLCF